MQKVDLNGIKIFGIEDVKIHKPNPEIFLIGQKYSGLNKSECLIIEDSPSGVEAAKRAKINSVALLTTNIKSRLKNATYCVKDYRFVKDEWLGI